MRNIGYETDEAKFKEFMQKFGPVKYAVLCKPNRVIDQEELKVEGESAIGA